MTKKMEIFQSTVILIVFVLAVWYMYNKVETFQSPSRPVVVGNPVPIVKGSNRTTTDLDLCDPDNDDLKNDMKKGVNIIYMNHVNNNIKKIIDDYVNIQLLTDRMESINKNLMLRLHKNKKYEADGEMTFV